MFVNTWGLLEKLRRKSDSSWMEGSAIALLCAPMVNWCSFGNIWYESRVLISIFLLKKTFVFVFFFNFLFNPYLLSLFGSIIQRTLFSFDLAFMLGGDVSISSYFADYEEGLSKALFWSSSCCGNAATHWCSIAGVSSTSSQFILTVW